jgi:transposase-like protein
METNMPQKMASPQQTAVYDCVTTGKGNAIAESGKTTTLINACERIEPATFQEAIVYFSDPVNCLEWIAPRRWPDGVECPRCGSKKVSFLPKYNRWQCGARHASRQFTVKTGTIFEDSPLGLDKWLAAMWQVVNDQNGISSWEVHRALGVSQKTGWFMDHRIRHALTMGNIDMVAGEIEANETFVGGKGRNTAEQFTGPDGSFYVSDSVGHPDFFPNPHRKRSIIRA